MISGSIRNLSVNLSGTSVCLIKEEEEEEKVNGQQSVDLDSQRPQNGKNELPLPTNLEATLEYDFHRAGADKIASWERAFITRGGPRMPLEVMATASFATEDIAGLYWNVAAIATI